MKEIKIDPKFWGPTKIIKVDIAHGDYPEHFDVIHTIGDQGAIKTRIRRDTLEPISLEFVPSKEHREKGGE